MIADLANVACIMWPIRTMNLGATHFEFKIATNRGLHIAGLPAIALYWRTAAAGKLPARR